jgi:hypothetical protein
VTVLLVAFFSRPDGAVSFTAALVVALLSSLLGPGLTVVFALRSADRLRRTSERLSSLQRAEELATSTADP